jgi:hypothetical protein
MGFGWETRWSCDSRLRHGENSIHFARHGNLLPSVCQFPAQLSASTFGEAWRQRKHMDDGFGRPQPATNWSKHTIRIEASKSNDDYPNGLLVFLNYPLRREG